MPKIKNARTSETAALTKIKMALKTALKQNGHTYRDIAELWDCSEPTVKRLLGAEELPTTRLLSLLEFLGLTLKELHALMEAGDLGAPKWTARQIEFLAKNPRPFAFLVKLYEGGAPNAIARKYKVAQPDLDRILIQLERHDLIRVGTKGEVRPWHSRMPDLEGKLGDAHMNRILDRVNFYLKSHLAEVSARRDRGLEKSNRGTISFSVSRLSEKSYEEFVEKLQRLLREMDSIANIEENSKAKPELKPVMMMTALVFNKTRPPGLDQLEDIFFEDLQPVPVKDERDIPRGL